MTNAQDTLKDRLQHADDLVGTFLAAEMHERITPRLMDALLFSLQDLLEQAQAAFQEMCGESKPDADDDGLTLYEDMCLTLGESLKLAAESNRLVHSVLTDLPVRNPYGAGCPEEVQS